MRAQFEFAVLIGLIACGEAPPHRAAVAPAPDAPGLKLAAGNVAPGSFAADPRAASAAYAAAGASASTAPPDRAAVAPVRAEAGAERDLAGRGSDGARRDEAVARPGASSNAPERSGAPTPDAAMGASGAAIEGAGRLTHLFAALAALEGGHARDDVRILHFGDSHTASDSIPGVYRRQLQARFGDGGRGFVPLGLPWKNYVQEGIRGGMSKEFATERVRAHDGRPAADGDFGLLGVAIATDRPGARAWTQVTVPAKHIEIDYLAQPNGGSADVYVDGAPVGRLQSRASQREAAFFARDVSEAPHLIEVRAAGDGALRLFGTALDRPRAGVIVDALGINGAQIYTPLRWSEVGFAEQLRHRAPDLVVIAYGTNEALDPKLDLTDYERSLVELLGRFARAVPSASCLLLGPPDLARHMASAPAGAAAPARREAPAGPRSGWYSWPPLTDVIAVQRRVAHAGGCAFFDQREAMGGAGTMSIWAAEPEPRAQADRVHFTRSGYAQLATAFSTELLRAYDAWRAGAPSSVAAR